MKRQRGTCLIIIFLQNSFMFIKSILSVLLSALAACVYAQTPEPVIAKIKYRFIHHYDTTNNDLIKTERYVLWLGKSSSVYKSYDRVTQDSAMAANYHSTGLMKSPSGKRANGEELFSYFDTKQAYLKVRLLGNFAVEQPWNDFQWKILKDTKTIQGVKCQKATAGYKGRNYIAWFSPDYPFQAGPWKLHGLPGLIIAAQDTKGRIEFEFLGFEQLKAFKQTTAWDARARVISSEEYKRAAKALEADPIGYAEKRFNVSITTSAKPVKNRNILAPDKAINYPLEVEANGK